jgi:hypothetical protein
VTDLLHELARIVVGPRLGESPDERDVAFYQSILDSQIRSLDEIDAILSATGVLAFSAMTYLLSTDAVRSGQVVARLLAVALLVPVALIGVAIIGYPQLDAPDIGDLEVELQRNRAAAFASARQAIVEAFQGNLETILAKRRFRFWTTLLAAAFFLSDLLIFVVGW